MKTIKYLTLRLMAVAAIAIAFALPAKAQVTPFTYFNVDWQFNAPISNNFANKASGWGMNFEGGYYILPDLSIGAFINYHTNNEYISRQTLPISNSAALTTDQQHSVFQLPFGFATHRLLVIHRNPKCCLSLRKCKSHWTFWYSWHPASIRYKVDMHRH